MPIFKDQMTKLVLWTYPEFKVVDSDFKNFLSPQVINGIPPKPWFTGIYRQWSALGIYPGCPYHTGARPKSQGFVLYVYLHFAGDLSITSRLRSARFYSFVMGKFLHCKWVQPKEPQMWGDTLVPCKVVYKHREQCKKMARDFGRAPVCYPRGLAKEKNLHRSSSQEKLISEISSAPSPLMVVPLSPGLLYRQWSALGINPGCPYHAIYIYYCHVQAGWGLQQTTLAPGSDKTRGQGSFGPLTGGLIIT